jgi:hypothetical protein
VRRSFAHVPALPCVTKRSNVVRLPSGLGRQGPNCKAGRTIDRRGVSRGIDARTFFISARMVRVRLRARRRSVRFQRRVSVRRDYSFGNESVQVIEVGAIAVRPTLPPLTACQARNTPPFLADLPAIEPSADPLRMQKAMRALIFYNLNPLFAFTLGDV